MAPFGRMSSEFFLMPHEDQSLADEERHTCTQTEIRQHIYCHIHFCITHRQSKMDNPEKLATDEENKIKKLIAQIILECGIKHD